MSRIVEQKMALGQWNVTTKEARNFLTFALKAPEHTWGLCFFCYLADTYSSL